ncbi:putative alpha-mannosidase [Vitis vinifera]|uniref:Alpha-mannosidase n=1 Tax=Vitis vinifera TaxID=29760 RepID=A0A438K9U1_VITVI|nr:putative alpha-mannosidase [Vitis vinifera]
MAAHPLSLLLILLLGVLLPCGDSKFIAYNTSHGVVPGKLNVHLVPHSHDDVGWLKTIDQYYVGSNNSIQGACVENVLDSLVTALLSNPDRKFIYVEQAFFQRWWGDQSEIIQGLVRKFISSGQLELINGGMCMHDEATSHYIDMIDQTTLGHRFIKNEFNLTPRIGWQIDPFGHSAVQAYLLGAEVGFDSIFFARIDYQDRAKRKDEKSLEVIWQGSRTFGSSSQIFAGAFPENYEPPPGGFYYEVNDDSPIVQDNIKLFDYNVPDRVNAFVEAAIAQANITRTNHIMWTMGTDFKYQYANSWFRQMDKLIHYVNLDGRVNALYSTPSIYTDAKHAASESWPLKTDDYFPYADRINAYWTGYFTSRAGLKGYVRMMSSYYLAARQLEFFKGRNESGPTTDSLADALAIVQHHDAVTGTEKQHVSDDYAKRLSIGYKECPLLNISYCPPSEIDLSQGKNLSYNSLGWKREDVVRIPVLSENVVVRDSSGKEIESQILPLANAYVGIRNYYVMAHLGKIPAVTPQYWLAFSASVPPLGLSTYFISKANRKASTSMQTLFKATGSATDTIAVGPGNLKLIYSENEGKLVATLTPEAGYYTGNDGSADKKVIPQASGAYVFRPNGSYPIKSEEQGALLFCVDRYWMKYIKESIHGYLRSPEYTREKSMLKLSLHCVSQWHTGFQIGPIPIDDGQGKEVVADITTAMKSNKTFYTDSSGRDFIERIRDYRKDWHLEVNQPVAGNYYPLNLGIFMKDDSTELSMLVDRAVGGSSIVDGQLELMLHRRLVHDDSRGVAEALNETVQGKFFLRIDPLGEGAKWRRSFGQEIYSPFLLAFTEQDGKEWTSPRVSTFSGLDPSYSLPDNVAMITLQELEDGKVLLRLAHLYEVGEDKDLSVMASVELKKLFPNKKISSAEEMSLSANQGRAEMEKKRLVWKAEGSPQGAKAARGGAVDPAGLVVELGPMEIRTFVISFL